jgi:GH25 family lysozyme M1 (1,4-beta-N-acetylmuramidase)
MVDLVRGGDYSRFQGVIDWDQLPAERRIAILGMWDWKNLVVDNQLARNVSEAKRTGRVVGGYMRVNPTRWTAAIEAKRMLDLLAQHDLDKPGCLWPSVDIELTITPADASVNWPQWTREFFAAWRILTSLPLIVYTSGSWFKSLLGGTDDWPDWVKVWVGHTEQWGTPKGILAEQWAGKTSYELSRAVIHQYSHTGRLSGITGDVDLDCLMPGVALESITLQGSGGTMPDIWLPGWKQHLFPLRGKPYQFTHNPKGCLHSTEGGSIAGALSAYAPYPPHGIYDWRTREKLQHIPLNYASYSAMDGNDDDYMVQIELVGFAGSMRDLPDEALRNIAEDVIAPIEKAFKVPRVAIGKGFKDAKDGISPPLASTNSPIRLTWEQLRDFSGWLGHQHLPSPDEHWDPGALPIQKIFNYMQEGDEVSAQEVWDHRIDKDPSESDPRTNAAAWEMLKYTNKAAWAAHDKVDALAGQFEEFKTAVLAKLDDVGSGGVDVKALATALAGPLGDNVRTSVGDEVYNKLVYALKNTKGSISLNVSGSGGL